MNNIKYSKKIILSSRFIFLTLFFSLLYSPAQSKAIQSIDAIWRSGSLVSKSNSAQIDSYSKFTADTNTLRGILSAAPDIKNKALGLSGAYLYLPLDDGSFSLFEVFENVSQSKTKKNYIKTFKAFGITRPELIGHLDIGARGFHAMIMGSDKPIYIDPDFLSFKKNKLLGIPQEQIPNQYRSFKKDKAKKFQCGFESLNQSINKSSPEITPNILSRQVGSELRTYKLAVTTSALYAETVSIGNTDQEKIEETLEAIATAINRVNVIYNQDLAIHLELVSDNRLIVLDPETNPFSDNAENDIDIVTEKINEFIGSANYDVGHLFTVSGGGLAFFQSVCDTQNKGKGVTGVNIEDLQNDAFYIDYVAHEIGHQFGANHTFNATSGACGGNRNSTTAFEPGSGSTIMAYAGICGSQDLQISSDPYFHAGSIDEILSFVGNASTGGSCNTVSEIPNNPPIVDPGSDHTIPAKTPFKLTASGSDAEDDPITYTWEQMDTGASTNSQAQMKQDNGSSTLFRSFLGTSSPVRYLPSFDDVLDNTLSIGETFPSTTRKLNFRVTARSGFYGTDTNSENSVVIQTIDTGSSFSVIEPEGDSYHFESNNIIVLWDIANTQNNPINCTKVDILFTNTGGSSYESFNTLLSDTPNDGGEIVTLPAGITNNARILVQCSDNIFYNINKGNFNIINSDATLLSISIDTPSQNEGNSGSQTFYFKVKRTGNLNLSSSVDYIQEGFGLNPTNEQDFISNQVFNGTLNFNHGESEKIITFKAKGDLLVEENEQFKVTLSNPNNAFISTANAIATIVNDDNGKKKSSGGSLIFLQLFLLALYLFLKKSWNSFIFLAASIFMIGCSHAHQDTSAQEPTLNHIQNNAEIIKHPQIISLLWVKNAHPSIDAKDAIENNELIFLASSPRGLIIIPGLNKEQENLAIKQGYKIQDGMGDLILNNEHQSLRKTFINYASQYNKILASYLFTEEVIYSTE